MVLLGPISKGTEGYCRLRGVLWPSLSSSWWEWCDKAWASLYIIAERAQETAGTGLQLPGRGCKGTWGGMRAEMMPLTWGSQSLCVPATLCASRLAFGRALLRLARAPGRWISRLRAASTLLTSCQASVPAPGGCWRTTCRPGSLTLAAGQGSAETQTCEELVRYLQVLCSVTAAGLVASTLYFPRLAEFQSKPQCFPKLHYCTVKEMWHIFLENLQLSEF